MEKRLKNYLAAVDTLLRGFSEETGEAGAERREALNGLIADHLVQIGFFQHERLIHLIVTCLFAVLTFAVFFALLAFFNIGLTVLFAALLVLLVPYIRHYYILENGVQRMYVQYDCMKELLKASL